MKKILFLFITVIFFSFGCSKNEENDEYDFQGISITPQFGWNYLTIFVEDNYRGFDIVRQYDISNIDLEHYWVEAYRVELTEDTKLISDITGEEWTFAPGTNYIEMINQNMSVFDELYRFGRRLAVKVEEDFENTILENRTGYILTNQEFLPIYTAKEIRLLPYTYEELKYNIISIPGNYTVLAVFDRGEDIDGYVEFDSEKWIDLENMNEQLMRENTNWYIHLLLYDIEEFLKYPFPMELNNFPVFIIFDHETVVEVVETWDELIEFFEEKYDMEFNL